jgi:hypothetical protein
MRSFLYLVTITILALLAIMFFAPNKSETTTSAAGSLLLPEMAEKINQVDRLEVVSAGNEVVVTLNKVQAGWQLEQMDGYPADWPKLQALLAGLARARITEVKTDKVEYYSRLGVEDIASEDAGSVLIMLSAGDLHEAVLIGNEVQDRDGTYVRIQDSAASALIDQSLDVPKELLEWADQRIIDINASEVAEVEIIHPQDGRILVTRISADQTDFDLVGLQPEREIRSSWAVNSLASVLTMLDLESVQLGQAVDWGEAVKMRVLTFSGMEIIADLLETDGEYLLRLKASLPGAKFTPQADNADIAKQAIADMEKRTADVNQRVDGWVYNIAKPKYDAMVKKPEDLLKPIDAP